MTDGHMDRQIHRELKEIKGRMGSERNRYTDRHIDREINRRMHKETDTWTERCIEL
jgi:hypothetical protein